MANGIQIAGKKTHTEIMFLHVKCPMPIKKHYRGVYFIFINVLYFSLITQHLEENSSISFVSFRYIGVILCDYFYNVQCIQ